MEIKSRIYNARLLIAVVLLNGCSALNEMPRGEAVWQGLHAVDVLQTLNGPADDDCYSEGDPVTRRIIGRKPSKGKVVAWGVGMGVLHYTVSDQLRDRPLWLAAWQLLSIGNTTIAINNNLQIGIKPVGDNDHSKTRGCRFNPSAAAPNPAINPTFYPVK